MSPARTTPPHPIPGKATIYAAIPGGSRRARSQRAYLAALLADPELAELRADARRSRARGGPRPGPVGLLADDDGLAAAGPDLRRGGQQPGSGAAALA